ncbi:MAG: hypothetical protein ACU83P_08880, partial [Gammaproteobacteria bacterium]
LMAALTFLPPSASASFFNYIYIEASEGNSSGGHTAIQFEDDIYHYQHVDSGLIRLFRQEKDDFHFLYRYAQNRPMHISRIEVSEDTFDRLKNQFKWQFLAQENQFKLLDAQQKERIFIRHLLDQSAVGHAAIDADATSILRLKGVGLFYPDTGKPPQHPHSEISGQQSMSIRRLREKVEQRYGTDFLQRRREQFEAQIRALTPTAWPQIGTDPAGTDFPAPLYSFTERHADALTALFALKTLVEAPPLQSDALVQTHQTAFKISEPERPVLQELRRDLETGLIEALDSNRPDWGYAVLVNLARYLAIEASLESGYWVFVDDFADASEWVRPDQYLEHLPRLRILIHDAGTALNRLRQSAVSRRHLSEADYSRIEMAANRYSELRKSGQRRDLRLNGEKALPSKSIGLPSAPLPQLTKNRLTDALAALDTAQNRLSGALKARYRYDLILRNCVTELFRTLDAAMAEPYRSGGRAADLETWTRKESEKRLGGYVEIPYNFIPFVAYQSVRKHYRVTQSHDLASYRGLELAKLKSRHNALIEAVRESNTVSSRLYAFNPDDALFLFFTDNAVLLRPLFGLANTAAGVGQSIYGFFSWPLDAGKNLKSGATGILMSLPELFFFNMRKGSYKYLSPNQLTLSDSAEDRSILEIKN